MDMGKNTTSLVELRVGHNIFRDYTETCHSPPQQTAGVFQTYIKQKSKHPASPIRAK